jgi:small multidrug resistance pump
MLVAWSLLLAAIGVEVASTASLARTQGFRDPGWTAAVLLGYALSIWLLTLVIREIPVSVAYAVWSGLGTAGIAVVGVTLLDERLDVVGWGALVMIIAGVVLLNLRGAH